MDFRAISPRLCLLRLRGNFANLSIISAYAPTEEGDDDEKRSFYDEIDHLWGSCPKHDVKIIMGDFNAKIGRKEEFRPVIGKFSLHLDTNDNGSRLISFAASHDMII